MKLIRHLPLRLAEIKEIADIQEAVEPEVRDVERAVRQFLINRNPLEADLEGVRQWEEWLKIHPLPTKTLEQRRYDIIAHLNERLPFTMPQLYRMLTAIAGEGNVELESPPGRAVLDVQVDVSERDAGGSIFSMLQRVVPAHVLWRYMKIHQDETTDLRALATGIQEHIVETGPEEKTYQANGYFYISGAHLVETVVETGIEERTYQTGGLFYLNNAHLIESMVETRS